MSTDAKVVGYCRTCGKALDEASARPAAGAIYCEEHVPPPAPEASPYTAPAYHASPPPLPGSHSGASPALAFVLGLIPGVGAVYNGQYAKGLVHVVILGLIFSILGNHAAQGLEPVFGVLIPCFWFYMAFEAYHTAKKREQGETVGEFSSLIPVRGAPARFPVAPVLLIALGVVFLLNNLEILELRRALRFWPALLIVLGGYLLYIRLTSEVHREP
jgi:Domain of unknown function (DUF5668)